eukprot:CAMPEP_0172402220 /NCGR_PEP_ID=MMETSP1061-20121228/53806_1 /TAXON_ID=37318 /ORGANISM="Pseudo-nitzschia pungens, Strain cf. pungens" /LENGTH=418 /DNA_ID=CAMNT_0013136137 /DNA_START=392 /DNA_END=1651 /DNA_ORIENTATION=-
MKQRIKHARTNGNTGCPQHRGSFMTSTHPTKEALYRWFGVEGEDPNQFMRGMMLRNEFNHNISGITNPFLKIQRSCTPQLHHACNGDAEKKHAGELCKSITRIADDDTKKNSRWYEKTVMATNRKTLCVDLALDSSIDVEKSWWPSLQIFQNDDPHQKENKETSSARKLFRGRTHQRNGKGARDGSLREQDWRILTYRKRVGNGKECYEKVRDAALDWEFQSADGTTGMMQIPEARPNDDKFPFEAVSARNKRSYSIQPIDNDGSGSAQRSNTHSSASSSLSSSSLYRSLGSRRLVSFASKSVTGFLPSALQRRIYSVNPVMVVYDVVDQRAPDGQSTFTSTAYSTLKGHFLRGEERVTVALRDGSQDVEVEILSISRAGPGLVGKTLWPFIGKMQSRFFRQQLQHLHESGCSTNVEN